MAGDFQVVGQNEQAPFTLKLHRGDGMVLVAMNWRHGKPPKDFVGFAIEYQEPGGSTFYAVKNRLGFRAANGQLNPETLSSRLSPIQKFRWVHFPRNAELPGEFVYRVTPVFMDTAEQLSYGDPQQAAIELQRETYPGQLNVAFTRGFVSSQAFVERYECDGDISTLLPGRAKEGLDFTPTHPKAEEAKDWMGFEARRAILDVLDKAVADASAQVRVVAYDLNEPEVVTRLAALGGRLKIIIDNSGEHGGPDSAETTAATRLAHSCGAGNVKRQHMGRLQHNKTITVDGHEGQWAVCGSTNFSWRGLFVQANNALVVQGAKAVKPFAEAFDSYWSLEPGAFCNCASACWCPLDLHGIKAEVAFSPHSDANALLEEVAEDIRDHTTSSLFFSLAFLYQTPGAMQDAIREASGKDKVFAYGISDRRVGGLDLKKPNGNIAPVYPAELAKDLPAPFRKEPAGGGGARMHHKFVVIDFDKPTARVYLGSYNFSSSADRQNGENLLLVRDRRVAVSYVDDQGRPTDEYPYNPNGSEQAIAGFCSPEFVSISHPSRSHPGGVAVP